MAVQSHRQAELDGVTVLPWPAQSEITAAAGKDRQHSAVYLHAPALGPIRNAQMDGHGDIRRPLRRGEDGQPRPLLLRELRLLPQANFLLRPIDFRGYEKIDVN